MATKVFSKKEAISHGFTITKKYFKFILLVILIVAVFQGIVETLNYQAGEPVTKDSVRTIYRDSAQAEALLKSLHENGYIDGFGNVQASVENITSPVELILPENSGANRIEIFNLLKFHSYRLPFPKIVYYLIALALWVVGMFIQIGTLKMSILLSRDQKPAISELFSNGSLFIPFVLGAICFGLVVLGGFILLIVPAFIFMVMFGLYTYFIVDQEMGPIQSLKASQALTKGARWQLFCFGLLLALLNLGGLLCLVVGLLFTIPASSIAAAYVYDQLSREEEPLTSAPLSA